MADENTYSEIYDSLQQLLDVEFAGYPIRKMVHHRGQPTIIAVACGVRKNLNNTIDVKSIVFTCNEEQCKVIPDLGCSKCGTWGSGTGNYPYPITLRILQDGNLINHHISRFRQGIKYDLGDDGVPIWGDDLREALSGIDRYDLLYCWSKEGGNGYGGISLNKTENFCIPSESCRNFIQTGLPNTPFKLYFKCYGGTDYFSPDCGCDDYIDNNPYGNTEGYEYYAYGGCYFTYDGVNLYGHEEEPRYTQPSDLSITTTNVTGTTATVSVTWKNGSSTISDASVTCTDGTTKQVSKDGSITFTGLSKGQPYTFTAKIDDGQGKGEGISALSASVIAVTYKVNFGTTSSNTKKISVSASANQDNKNLKYKINAGSEQGPISSGSYISKDNLTHGTTYTITCWIDGMRNTNGDLDTIETIDITTKTLSLINTNNLTTQFGATSNWQAYADTDKYDDNIVFVIDECNIKKRGESSVAGTTSGTYKTLDHTGLESYTDYTIKATVSDGYNKASATVDVKTQFPYIRVYDGTKWRKAIPYIYDGSNWKIAKPMEYNGTSWKECNYD